MADRYASLKQGLVGCWIPSISGSGLLLPDLSGRGNNGALTNMDASDWVSSQHGRALDFDGSNDVVSISGSVVYAQNGQPFTASIHAYVRNFTNQYTKFLMLRSDCVNGNAWEFGVSDRSSYLGIVIGTNGSYARIKTDTLAATITSGWHHYLVVYNGGDRSQSTSFRIYFDGTLQVNSGAGDFSGTTNTSSISLNAANNRLNGVVDDIRIYNRALSESEIRLLASRPGIGFKPAKKLSRFSQRFTYKPPKAKVFEGVRVRDHDYASLRQGLVGAWCPSLPNGGSGNTLPDVSGRGNHGTLTNMDASDWVSGQYGRALDFDGANDYVSIADSNQLDVTGPVSLAIWVRGTSTANKVLTEKGTNKTLVLQPNGANEFYYLDGSAGPAIVSGLNTLIFNGNWHSITATFNGATRSLYVDGVLRHTSAMSTPSANADEFVIGARSGGSFVWAGQLDDIRIYNRALTESEIRLLASRPGIGLQPSPTRLIAREKKTGLRRKILTGQT